MNKQIFNCVEDDRGSLVPVEFFDIPFKPKRLFWVSGMSINTERGGHAHYKTQQYIFCMKGKILVKQYDGHKTDETFLYQNEGIFIDKLIWDSQIYLTGDDVSLVLCSTKYNKHDYIFDLKQFEEIIKSS